MNDIVTIDIQDHVADVRLNRPEKMNSLNLEMFEAIVDAGKQLESDKSVRAIVLSGEGRCFCAGLDLDIFSDPTFLEEPFGDGKGGFWPNFYQQPAYIWKTHARASNFCTTWCGLWRWFADRISAQIFVLLIPKCKCR